MTPPIVVVSTGKDAPTKQRCLASVRKQTVHARHVYVEASAQSPPRSPLQNRLDAIAKLSPDTIVAFLDGDDWLFNSHCLSRVLEEHHAGAWVTYGSFVYEDESMGFAAPVRWPPREHPWTSTHLKTIRAGLIHRIKPEDLTECEVFAPDVALMLPALEMAGPGRSVFVPEVLYVYTRATAWGYTAPEQERHRESDAANWVRSRPAYARLEAL